MPSVHPSELAERSSKDMNGFAKKPVESMVIDEELDYDDSNDSHIPTTEDDPVETPSPHVSLNGTPELAGNGSDKENEELTSRGKFAGVSVLQMDADRFHVGELDYGEEDEADETQSETRTVRMENIETEVVDWTEADASTSTGSVMDIDLDQLLDDVIKEGIGNEQCSEEIEQAFNFTDSGFESGLSAASGSPKNPAKSTPTPEPSFDSVDSQISIRQPAPPSPEIFPPPSAAPVRRAKEKMRCFLAYRELHGFPNIRTSYPFLKKQMFPVRHQFLHICHYESEAVLMTRVCHLLNDVFDYNKVIITARRSERVEDIWNALKLHCDLDSLLITDDSKKDRNIKIFDHFERGTRRILACPCSTHPPRRCLTGVNLVIYWNGPWCLEHFKWMLERLPSKAIILMVLKQEHDWKFLDLCKESFGIVFPELDVDSKDEDVAGYINSRFRKEI